MAITNESGETAPSKDAAAASFRLVHIVSVTLAGILFGGSGGIGLGSLTSKDDGSSRELALLTYQVGELGKKVDALTVGTLDRWTASHQREYENKHDQRDAMRAAEALAREAAMRARVERLEGLLSAHDKEPWHVQAGAEHSETRRRLDRAVEEVKELRAELRAAVGPGK